LTISKFTFVSDDLLILLLLADQTIYIPVYFIYENEEIKEIVSQLKNEYENGSEKGVVSQLF